MWRTGRLILGGGGGGTPLVRVPLGLPVRVVRMSGSLAVLETYIHQQANVGV